MPIGKLGFRKCETETAGNTEKPVRLPDSIFTFPPEEEQNNRLMFPVRNFAFPQHKQTLTIAEIRDS